MKSNQLIILLILLWVQPLFSQRTYKSDARFEYTFEVGPQQFVINYDIDNLDKKEEYKLSLSIVDEHVGKLVPKTFEVDFKDKTFKAGQRKSVVWYWKQDYPDMKSVKVDLQLQPVKYLGGPEQAFKSLLFPGWGDRSVSDKKLPYYLIGIAAYSLVSTGVLLAGPISDNTHDKYRGQRDVKEMDIYIGRANNQYKAGQALISIGATIWLADIISTYVKGARNKEQKKYILAEKPLFKDLKELKYYDIETIKKQGSKKGELVWGFSDVDAGIPMTTEKKPHTYALIIGNEDYKTHQTDLSAEINVDYAEADATYFKEYMVKTLGIPEKNVIFLINATSGAINQAIAKINALSMVEGGNAELIFYYAGHGLPDENTKEPYIIPVDVSGANIQYAIKLKDIYSKLTEHPAKRVTVFMDACFSGGARNQGLVSMRGVKVKPKEQKMQGNLIIFSSSSGDESSGSYKEKQHGLFTYFLLKKLKETKGEVTYGELSAFIIENVKKQSVLINNKLQTPQILGSEAMKYQWQEWEMKQKGR